MKEFKDLVGSLRVLAEDYHGSCERKEAGSIKEYYRGKSQAYWLAARLLEELLNNKEHQQVEVEEEEIEDWEDEFEFLTLDEISYALASLPSKPPDEIVCLICKGKKEFPKWLKKEILERRK